METAYAAHMQFGVPVWFCLNRVLLADFAVPDGLGIRVVHVFADFDAVDPRTKKSPGVDAALKLAKRLRAEGFTAIVHRPKKREKSFCTSDNEKPGQCAGFFFVYSIRIG